MMEDGHTHHGEFILQSQFDDAIISARWRQLLEPYPAIPGSQNLVICMQAGEAMLSMTMVVQATSLPCATRG